MRHNIEMADAVIGMLADASQQVDDELLNPFRAQNGEIRPTDVERNFSGFLVRKDVIPFEVDSLKLLSRNAMLKHDSTIGCKLCGAQTFLSRSGEMASNSKSWVEGERSHLL